MSFVSASVTFLSKSLAVDSSFFIIATIASSIFARLLSPEFSVARCRYSRAFWLLPSISSSRIMPINASWSLASFARMDS